MSIPAEKLQSLTPDEAMATVLHFMDVAKESLHKAPPPILIDLDAVREKIEDFKESLPDALWQEIDAEGDYCKDCEYCERDPGGPWDQPMRECTAKKWADCWGCVDILA